MKTRGSGILIVVTMLGMIGCGASPVVQDEPAAVSPGSQTPVVAPSAPLEPFTQALSGTIEKFEMRPVPRGAVQMPDGSRVEIKPFYLSKTEITWDLYDVFVFETDRESRAAAEPDADAVTRPSRPYIPPDRGFGHAGYATISVAHRGAQQFCVWLSAKSGRKYRLPTEAEFRHACSQSGIDNGSLDQHAWHDGNSGGTPHAVASLAADSLGLHDLFGNAREWCTAADGSMVAMGGSFLDPPDQQGPGGRHVYARDWQMTDPQVPKSPWWLSDAPFMGFRVVCEP